MKPHKSIIILDESSDTSDQAIPNPASSFNINNTSHHSIMIEKNIRDNDQGNQTRNLFRTEPQIYLNESINVQSQKGDRQQRVGCLQEKVQSLRRQIKMGGLQNCELMREKKQLEYKIQKLKKELQEVMFSKEQNEKFSNFAIKNLQNKLEERQQENNATQNAVNYLDRQKRQIKQRYKQLCEKNMQLQQKNRLNSIQMEQIQLFLYKKLQKQMQDQKQKLEDKLCAICFQVQGTMGLYPCGHIGFCQRCITRSQITNRKCPICKKISQGIFKFFSK